MNEIVCRRKEIGSANKLPLVPEQELPRYRYKSLQFFADLPFISD
jgi:hypothetical protein